MAFTEFCCRSGGSNLNAGTLTGNSTEPGTSASFTYASGNWVAATGVFTVASGNPSSDGVAVGDFASVYADGSTVTGFVGRVTARDATTITVSLTAASGTAPTDGTGNRTIKIGGAWKGPNGAEDFPCDTITAALTNSAGDLPRINFKNDADYLPTAAIQCNTPDMTYEGYSSSYGDQGKATFDFSTNAVNYFVFGATSDFSRMANIVCKGSASSGTLDGIALNNNSPQIKLIRVVVSGARGFGFACAAAQGVHLIECEAYGNNTSNTANRAGFNATGNATFIRCISHDNTTSNTRGFLVSGNVCTFISCIADTNGNAGFGLIGGNVLLNCDAYNNAGSGAVVTGASPNTHIENCNFVKNGAYGIDLSAATLAGCLLVNNGFGAGTQANTSGSINAPTASHYSESGSVNYAADVTPWVDPANGDFRISLAAAKNAGRGAYTQTAASYAGTVGYPDIGAAQHQDSGSGGVIVVEDD